MNLPRKTALPSGSRRQFSLALSGTALALAAPTIGRANDAEYPMRTVRFVNWSNPGGNLDFVARLLAEHANKRWNQSVITDNKIGASGIIAHEFVAKSPADGYTVLITSSTGQVTNALVKLKLPYDPIKDFEPLSLLVAGNIALMAAANAPFNNLKELAEHSRRLNRPLSYGSFGIGTSAHLYGEAMRRQANIELTHVPYKTGELGAMNDVVGGSLDLYFMSQGNAKNHSQAGKVKILAISGDQRTKSLPAVATFAEQGFTGFGLAGWIAAYVPAGTPVPVVAKIEATFRETLKLPEVITRLENMGYDVIGSSADDLRKFQAEETRRFGGLVKNAGIVPE